MKEERIIHLANGDMMFFYKGVTVTTEFEFQTATIDFTDFDELLTVPLQCFFEIKQYLILFEKEADLDLSWGLADNKVL